MCVARRIAVYLGCLSFLVALPSAAMAASAAPPPLEIYGSLPATEAVELSADGTMLAMVGTEGDQRGLTIARTDGGVIAKASMGDAKFAGLSWAGNDYVIVYMHQTARLSFYSRFEEEFQQGIIVNVKDGTAKPLLRQSQDYLPAVLGHYGIVRHDGHWVGYYGVVPTERSIDTNARTGFFKQRFPDLYRVDFETGHVERVTNGTTLSRSWAVDGGGEVIAESEYDSNSGNWKVFRPGSPDQPLISGNSPFSFQLAGQSRTPGTLLVSEGGSDGEIVELHLDTGRSETFLPSGRAMQLIHSRSTHLLLGAVLVDDNDTLMFDPTLDRHYRSVAKAFAGKSIRLISTSDDLSRIVVHVSGKDTAGTWQLVDFKSGKSDPIAEDYPRIPDAMIGGVQMIDYRAADGLPMQGVLTLPPGLSAHDLPLVVLPHGGPQARDRAHFDWWAQAFAVRGYAVFQPNFRGSSGYGTAFRNAGFGQWGRKMQSDISDGVAALAAKGIVNPKRACIVGASYGGYAAMAGVTLQHGLYRCAASYGGVSDPRDLLYYRKAHDGTDTQHYADPAMRFTLSYLGFQSPDDPGLATVSPQEQAKTADAPILLIYGEKDTIVPPKQSRDMASALKSAGKPVELVELDGEDHWLSRSATRLQMLEAMVAFVEKYNPPNQPPTH
jgi:dipeptidyl aminopeptidase/acylaminoacyl peptidase